MADIRIDRYEVNVTSNGQTLTITDVGDVTKAFVRLTGSSTKSSGGPIGLTGNAGPNICFVGVTITATNQITFYGTNFSQAKKIMFEVWVYTGSDGGDYEFRSRQRGTVSVSGSTASTALSGVTDRNKVVPFYTGMTTTGTSVSDWEHSCFYCFVNSSTEVVFGRNNTGTTGVCYYDAVEFIGSAWRVGHGRSASHDTGNDVDGTGGEIVTLNTDSTGLGGSSFDTTDWGTAMVIEGTMGGDSSETGLSDLQLFVIPESNTSQVRFTLENTVSRNDSIAYCHVIQTDALVATRILSYNFTEGNNSYDALALPVGVNSSTPLNELSLEWFPGTSGEGTAWARGVLVAQLTASSGNGLQHWVHRSGNNVSANWAVVDVSSLIGAAAPTAVLKTWNGSSWITSAVKVWDGSSWTNVKFWDGTQWITSS